MDHVRTAGSEQAAPGDFVAPGGSATPAPGDVSRDIGPCDDCCVGEDCPLLPCSPWPPSQIDFTFSGVTAPTTCCLDVYSGFTFSFSYSVNYPGGCVNRTFQLPRTRSDINVTLGVDGYIGHCQWDYQWDCDIAIFDDPHWHMRAFVSVLAVAGSVTVSALVLVQPRAFHSTPSDFTCGFVQWYKQTYTTETFPCSGPWVLSPDPDGLLTTNDGWSGFPSSITLNPAFGGSLPSGASADCCVLTTTYCLAVDCVGSTTCTIVTPGTGTYATMEECLAVCGWGCVDGVCVHGGLRIYATMADCIASGLCGAGVSYNCIDPTQPCVDPGDGTGTYFELADCTAACVEACPTPPCGEGTPTDDGINVPCCDRGQVIGRTLTAAVVSAGGCPNLVSSIPLAWSDAYKAWVGAGPTADSSHFLTIALWCKDGSFSIRVWCEGALIFSQDGAYGTDTGTCARLSLQWSFTGVNGVGCCNANGTLFVHVFDPATY